jgi:hypothetical protein
MEFIKNLHILQETRLTSDLLDTTNIDQDHIPLIKQYLDDTTQAPILFYNLSKVIIEREQWVYGCDTGIIGSAEYSIFTDYKKTPQYTKTKLYTILVIHIEDIFEIMKNTIKEEIEKYVSMDAVEDMEMYNFYTPYVEDYIYCHTLNLENEECPICYDIPPTRITLKCEHTICDECKESMLVAHHTHCPICRTSIIPIKLTRKEFYDNLDFEDIEENVNFDKYTNFLIEEGLTITNCCKMDYTGIEILNYELFTIS